jgi:hypothetical protein
MGKKKRAHDLGLFVGRDAPRARVKLVHALIPDAAVGRMIEPSMEHLDGIREAGWSEHDADLGVTLARVA